MYKKMFIYNFILFLFFYIPHKIHKSCLLMHIHDFLSVKKNFQDTLFYKLKVVQYFQYFIFHDQHNLLYKKINIYILYTDM